MATLRESLTIALDNSGNGTAKLGPQSAREIWYPDSVSVKVNTATKEATCQIYTGDANTMRFRDQTFTGSTGDATDQANGAVKVGEYVWAIWTSGDAKAQATLTVTGTKTV